MRKRNFHRYAVSRALVLLAVAWSLATLPRPALAACENCACLPDFEAAVEEVVDEEHGDAGDTGSTRGHLTDEFDDLEEWLLNTVLIENIIPAMIMMTEQLSASAMQQVQIIGSFLDAKNQLETERLFQYMSTQAYKDYNASEGLCTLGTNIRALSVSDRTTDLTLLTLSRRALDRQLGNVNSTSSDGGDSDLKSRYAHFRQTYCDPNDNNLGLVSVCQGSDPDRRNKDVDFARTLGLPMTLDINFADGAALSTDEEDVFALASNLYGHSVLPRLPAGTLNAPANQKVLHDYRSIAAKRSVAMQSFQAIAAMKSSGQTLNQEGAEALQYLEALLLELGIPQAEITAIIGENPSYYAQMKILSQKIFQRPEFFIDLYDKPVNVARKGVALEALKLMQDRDIFESYLRTESMLSIILELELVDAQEAVQNRLNPIRQEGSN